MQKQAEDDGADRRSVVEDARVWLRQVLASGPRPAAELREEADARGIGKKTLYAAHKAEVVTVGKERAAHGRWFWALATTPDRGEGERSTEESPSLDS
jgi:putative DNA primase/helicase